MNAIMQINHNYLYPQTHLHPSNDFVKYKVDQPFGPLLT